MLEAERAACVDTLTALCARHGVAVGLATDEELAPAPRPAPAAPVALAVRAAAEPVAAQEPAPVAAATTEVATVAAATTEVATAPSAVPAAAAGAHAVEDAPGEHNAPDAVPDVAPAAAEAAGPSDADVAALRAAYAGHVTEEHEIDAAVERAAASEDFEQAEVRGHA